MSSPSPHLSQYTDEDFPQTDRQPTTELSMSVPDLDDSLALVVEPDAIMRDVADEQAPANGEGPHIGLLDDDGFVSLFTTIE